MKKLAFAAVIAATSLTAATAVADPPGDSVHGAAQILTAPGDGSLPNNVATWNARSGPNGEDPQGQVHFKELQGGAMYFGDVVCLRVQGNRASMLIAMGKTKDTPPRFEDGGAVIFVEDNGNPVRGTPVDTQRNFRLEPDDFAAAVAAGCPEPIDTTRPVESGNIHVNDAL